MLRMLPRACKLVSASVFVLNITHTLHRERLYGLLNQISEEGRSMDESSSRNIPIDVLSVLESNEFRGLEAFEQKLLATASAHAKSLRAKSKHLQVFVALSLIYMFGHNNCCFVRR